MSNRTRPKDEYDFRWNAIKRRRRHAVNSFMEDVRDRLLYEIQIRDEASFAEAEAQGLLLDVPPSTVSTDIADTIKALISKHVPELEPGDDVS